MCERRREAFRVGFDRSVKIEFRGSRITSDAGLLAFRELDEALGLTDRVADLLAAARTGLNTPHTLLAQLRQSVYSRLALPRSISHWSLRTLQTQVVQDRRESRQACPLHLFPDGGGTDRTESVRCHPETDTLHLI